MYRIKKNKEVKIFKINADSFIGIIYTLVLAIIIAIFVGVTLNTFYPAPTHRDSYGIVEDEAIQKEYSNFSEYRESLKNWSQNTSIIVLLAATLFVTIGLLMGGKIPIIPNGVLLGGLFTLFYGIILGFISDSKYIKFGVTTVALAIIIGAGYMKFVKPANK